MLEARRPVTIVVVAVVAGALIGLLARVAIVASAMIAILIVSAALAAIAQQTLP